jgi:pimeloyl-ACP methyl ester carboxylesterase
MARNGGASGMLQGEEVAKGIGPAAIDIAFQRIGDHTAPAVLLITGTHLSGARTPDLAGALAGDLSSASYTLSDMAADSVGLLDVLEVDSAHIVGASMGGQIAQVVALEHPDRVRSVVSMMSTTGAPDVGQTAPSIMAQLFGGPPVATRDDFIRQMLRSLKIVGSPAFPGDEAAIAARAGVAYDRGFDPIGSARQGIATIATGNRTQRLRTLHVPTLIIHGLDDRMCDPSGGRATADAIPGAELQLIEGMGHDFAPGLQPSLADRIGSFILRIERGRNIAHSKR